MPAASGVSGPNNDPKSPGGPAEIDHPRRGQAIISATHSASARCRHCPARTQSFVPKATLRVSMQEVFAAAGTLEKNVHEEPMMVCGPESCRTNLPVSCKGGLPVIQRRRAMRADPGISIVLHCDLKLETSGFRAEPVIGRALRGPRWASPEWRSSYGCRADVRDDFLQRRDMTGGRRRARPRGDHRAHGFLPTKAFSTAT